MPKYNFSKALASAMLDSKTYYCVITDLEGKYVFVNDYFLKKFGFLKDQIIGMDFGDTLHHEDIKLCNDTAAFCIMNPGKTKTIKVRKPTREGNFFWTQWEFTALFNRNRVPIGIICIGNDATQEIRNQLDLQDYIQRLDLVLESLQDGYIAIDYQGTISRVNQHFASVFRKRPENYLTLPWELAFKATQKAFFEKYIRKALQNQQNVHAIAHYQEKNLWFAISIYAGHEGITAYFRDITEQRRLDQDLELSKRKLKAIYDSSIDVHMYINPQYQILYFNKRAADDSLLTQQKTLLQGDNILSFLPEGLKTSFVEDFGKALTGEMVTSEKEVPLAQDIKIWFRTQYHPVVENGHIMGVAITISNIDEQKRFELMVKEQNQQLKEIAFVHSHELRRPLSSIMGLVYLIKRKKQLDQEAIELIEKLEFSSNELDKVIHYIVSMTHDKK
jgi:PAS domain S-box-containing protein